MTTGHCVSFSYTALYEYALQRPGLDLSEQFMVYLTNHQPDQVSSFCETTERLNDYGVAEAPDSQQGQPRDLELRPETPTAMAKTTSSRTTKTAWAC